MCGMLQAAPSDRTPEISSVPPSPSFEQMEPGLQAKTAYWLRIKVDSVKEVEGQYHATATVMQAYKASGALKPGDTIAIAYQLQQREASQKNKRRHPPQWVPSLREGQVTYAFLNKEADAAAFRPGAQLWSFAPPFGLSREEMQAAGMRMPKPPPLPSPANVKKFKPQPQTQAAPLPSTDKEAAEK